jgi:hypothetical protein
MSVIGWRVVGQSERCVRRNISSSLAVAEGVPRVPLEGRIGGGAQILDGDDADQSRRASRSS